MKGIKVSNKVKGGIAAVVAVGAAWYAYKALKG